MITKRDAQVEIQSNVDELNKILRRLSALAPSVVKQIIKKIAFGVFRDIVARTPIDTGRARRSWSIAPLNNGFTYKISNPTGYIIYLEYGIQGHPLSSDPEKRKNSLKYLFATGILQDNDGVIVYTYTPKGTNSEGFIRNTLQEWVLKAPPIIKEELTKWLMEKFKDLRK